MALAKLMNLKYAGKKLTTGFGTIEFNELGIAEVEDTVADTLVELQGFSVQKEELDEDTKEISPEEDSQKFEQENPVEDKELEEDSEEYTEEELDKLTVPQLKKIANEMGVNTKDLTKKNQLISAILA